MPFPSPGDLPNPEIKPESPALQVDASPYEPPGNPCVSTLTPRSQFFKCCEERNSFFVFLYYPFSTKEARIYKGEKTISLTSGAGKTGQPLTKE